MGADQHIDWARTAASALDWWRDAGVDVLVEDTPFDWLAAPVAEPTPVAAAPAATASGLPGTIPDTIDAFLAWRLSEAAPEAAWAGAKIAATGPVDADLMILVDCPERDDHDLLLSGAVGRLFDRMLAAIGRSRDDVHLTAVCAARPVAGRMPRDTEAMLGEIARAHVALVAPEKLLLLGNAASRAILPTDGAAGPKRLHEINHSGGKVTAVVTSFHPRFLMEKPAAKAEAWKNLQMLVGGMK